MDLVISNELQRRFKRHSKKVYKQALQTLHDVGWRLQEAGRFPEFWDAVDRWALHYAETRSIDRHYRRDPGGADVCAPEPIPNAYIAPPTGTYERLQTLGIVRCMRVAPLPGGRWSVLVRLNLRGRGNVYRYGELEWRDDADWLINKWIDKGYWTSDRS